MDSVPPVQVRIHSRMTLRSRACWLGAALVALPCVLLATRSDAAGPLDVQGQPIRTSAYRVDFFQGPVLASSRLTGLGGAYAAIAEGVDGYPVNAVSPAIRMPWSHDWFDFDASLGFTSPSSLADTDFDNNGSVGFAYQNFLFVTLGGNVQLGAWGFGASADVQTYRLGEEPTVPGAPPNLSATFVRSHLLLARTFADGQLAVGAGMRVAALSLEASDANGSGAMRVLFRTAGAGLQAGVLWAPHRLPFRVGLSTRSEVSSETDPSSETTPNGDGDIIVGQRFLPEHVVLPWEIEAGVAVQVGKRPLNLPWRNPKALLAPLVEQIERARAQRRRRPVAGEAEIRNAEDRRLQAAEDRIRRQLKNRYRALSRQKLLISASVLASGPVRNAVGVESFLVQRVDRSGESASFTPRLGLEAEPIAHSLQVRVGTYAEPSRFRNAGYRIHATGGFDAKLFDWSLFGLLDDDTYWRAGGFFDGSRHYAAWGASVGVWH